MCTIGEEERCSVRVNLSKNTGYTGISILHRLHKLYRFDVIQDTVFDMMHNLPLNVVRKHIKRVIEGGMVEKKCVRTQTFTDALDCRLYFEIFASIVIQSQVVFFSN